MDEGLGNICLGRRESRPGAGRNSHAATMSSFRSAGEEKHLFWVHLSAVVGTRARRIGHWPKRPMCQQHVTRDMYTVNKRKKRAGERASSWTSAPPEVEWGIWAEVSSSLLYFPFHFFLFLTSNFIFPDQVCVSNSNWIQVWVSKLRKCSNRTPVWMQKGFILYLYWLFFLSVCFK